MKFDTYYFIEQNILYEKIDPITKKTYMSIKDKLPKDKSYIWFMEEATLNDIINLVKSEVTPIPIEKSKFKYQPDDYMDMKDILKLKGEYGEKRKEGYNGIKGRTFGNYLFGEWYLFLKDIAQNGIKNPIFLVKDKNGELKVSEGNHRIQALKQLGYDKVPVEL